MDNEQPELALKKFEVTEDMISAGQKALYDSNYGRDPTAFSEDVVWAILFHALQAGGFFPLRR